MNEWFYALSASKGHLKGENIQSVDDDDDEKKRDKKKENIENRKPLVTSYDLPGIQCLGFYLRACAP